MGLQIPKIDTSIDEAANSSQDTFHLSEDKNIVCRCKLTYTPELINLILDYTFLVKREDNNDVVAVVTDYFTLSQEDGGGQLLSASIGIDKFKKKPGEYVCLVTAKVRNKADHATNVTEFTVAA